MEMRRPDVAESQHLEGDVDVATLVGVPERTHALERESEGERREDGSRAPTPRGRKRPVAEHVASLARRD